MQQPHVREKIIPEVRNCVRRSKNLFDMIGYISMARYVAVLKTGHSGAALPVVLLQRSKP